MEIFGVLAAVTIGVVAVPLAVWKWRARQLMGHVPWFTGHDLTTMDQLELALDMYRPE